MRRCFLTSILLLIALMAVIGTTSGVYSVGAPSENFTTPEVPSSDNTTPEVKPANFILEGPSAQPQTTDPLINIDFRSQSIEERYTVTGNENWELLVDINVPGWVYIYEYLPPGSSNTGSWIAYKWMPEQSGIWKLGPFIPAPNEPAGQHLYRVWFYANGNWAADDTGLPFKELNWIYITLPPSQAEPVSTPPEPEKEKIPDNSLYEFFTNPILLLAGPSVLVLIIVFIRYLITRSRSKKLLADQNQSPAIDSSPQPPVEAEKEDMAANLPPQEAQTIVRARLTMPNGIEINLNGTRKEIGRAEMARALELDDAALVSRKHLVITISDESYFIEDSTSTNGTCLNGKDISGAGPIKLSDNDVIELAGIIKLNFQIL